MSRNEGADRIKKILKALENFPKVVQRKERAYKEKQKVLRAFAPMAKELRKTLAKKKQEEGK